MKNIKVKIPKGYKLDKNHKQVTDLDIDGSGIISFRLKKKNEKKKMISFNDYVNAYLEKHNDDVKCNDIRNWVEDDFLEDLSKDILSLSFDGVPFEIKIGLLKFICDDISESFNEIMHTIHDNLLDYRTTKIKEICPELFLKSIFI